MGVAMELSIKMKDDRYDQIMIATTLLCLLVIGCDCDARGDLSNEISPFFRPLSDSLGLPPAFSGRNRPRGLDRLTKHLHFIGRI